MSYEDYWYGDTRIARQYLEAEKMKQKRMAETANNFAHLMGAYIYEALIEVSPILHAFGDKKAKPIPYRTKPFDLFSEEPVETEEEIRRREEAEALRAKAYMSQMMQNWKH